MRQIFVVLILAATLAPAGGQSGLPLIPADAGVIFGVEWRRLIESPAGTALTEQIRKSDMSRIPGLQGVTDPLLAGIDSVVVAAPASSIKSGSQPPALVVVKGRFDAAQIRGAFGGNKMAVEKYRSVELLGGSPGASAGMAAAAKTSVVAFLDANTLLGGDRAQVRAAIDRAQAGRFTSPGAGILAGAPSLAATNHIWMVIAPPPGSMKDVPAPMAQMLAGLVSMEMGVSFAEGMAMRVNIREKDEASAVQMAQAAQGLVAMAALSDQSNPQAMEMLKKLTIAPEGAVVKMALNLNSSELDQLVQQAQAQAGRAAGTGSAAAAAPRARGPVIRPPDPPKPNTVRITGLDGGPVEVPMTQPKSR